MDLNFFHHLPYLRLLAWFERMSALPAFEISMRKIPVWQSGPSVEVMACIMLAPETDATRATAEAIVGFTLGALAYFKAPGYVAFVEQLPMTTSQKIQRGEVIRLWAELLEIGECFDLRSQNRRRKPETPSA